MRHVQFEERTGNLERVCEIYEKGLEKFSKDKPITIFLLQEYAFFVWKVLNIIIISTMIFS